MLNFLRYGDKIILQSSFTNKDSESWGLLSAEGFYNERIYFETLGGEPSKSTSKNLRDNIFVVCPSLDYEFHKEYSTSLNFYDKIEKMKNNTLNSDGINRNKIDRVLDDLKQKMIKLQAKMDQEVSINKKIMKESKGRYVRYTDAVQLLHHKSKYFLTSRNVSSNTSTIGYQAEISRTFSEGMLMKILPRFNPFQDGDYIQSGDEVKIQAVETEFYLAINPYESFTDYSTFNAIKFDSIEGNQMNNLNFLNNDPKFGIYFNNTSKNGWKICIFQAYEANKGDKMCWSDLFRVIHFENGLLLTIQNSPDMDGKLLVLENSEAIDRSKGYSKYLWQAESVNLTEDSISTESLSHIKDFALRNIYANKITGLDDKDKISIVENIERQVADKYSINFVKRMLSMRGARVKEPALQKHDGDAESKPTTFTNSANYYLTCKNTPGSVLYLQSVYSESQRQMPEEVTQKLQISVEFTTNKEDSFIVQRISKEEQYWIFRALSLVKHLKSFIGIRNFENFIKKIDLYLVEIVMFIFDDKSVLSLQFPDLLKYKRSTPNMTKQLILQEFNMFELLIKILDKLNSDSGILVNKKIINKERLTENNFLSERVNFCKSKIYHCLLYLIKDNHVNQIYLSKWIDEFIKRVFESDDADSASAFNYESIIKSILRDNSGAVRGRLNAELIQAKLDGIPNPQLRFNKFVRILFFLCNAFSKNRTEMAEFLDDLLFERNAGLLRYLQYDLVTDCHYIRDGNNEPVELASYDKDRDEVFQFSKYFEVLNIIAESKEKLIMQKLRSIYIQQYDVVVSTLELPMLYDRLKEQLVKFVFNIWIKFYPNHKIKDLFNIKSIDAITTMSRNCFIDNSLYVSKGDYSRVTQTVLSMLRSRYFYNYTDKSNSGCQISEFQNTVFRATVWLFDYGILKERAEIKQVVESVFGFCLSTKIYSERLIKLLNAILKYNLNCTLTTFIRSLNELQQPFAPVEAGVLAPIATDMRIKKTYNLTIDRFSQKLWQAMYSDGIGFLAGLSKKLMLGMLDFVLDNENMIRNTKSKTTDEILSFMEKIFYYKKYAFKRFTEILYVTPKHQAKYQSALDTYFALKKLANIAFDKGTMASISSLLETIIEKCIGSESDYKLYRLIVEQYSGGNNNAYQADKLFYNIDIIFGSKAFDKVMQLMLSKANILDSLLKLLRSVDVNGKTTSRLYDKIIMAIGMVCAGNTAVSRYFWKKRSSDILELLETDRISYLFLLNVMIANNSEALKNYPKILELFKKLDKGKLLLDVIGSKAIDSYFISRIFTNLALYHNRLIIYNQSAISSDLTHLLSNNADLFERVVEYCNNTKNNENAVYNSEDIVYTVVNPDIAAVCALLNLLAILTKGHNSQKTNALRNMVSLK